MEKCGQCLYQDSSGANCKEPALESGLCFWHDPDEDKCGEEIKEKLENHAKSGGMLQGISLKKPN